MDSRTRKRVCLVAVLSLLATLLILSPVIAPVCYLGMGWTGTIQTCECAGIEWTIQDEMPADGETRSVCLGYIESVTVNKKPPQRDM